MVYECDNCGTELGETAVACRGYNHITCSSSCMAALMLNLHRVDTAKFLKEEITREDYGRNE